MEIMKTPDIRGPVTESSADRDESLFNSQTLIPGTIWPRRWCEKLLEQECVIPFKDHWNRSWLYLSNCKLQTASSCWVLTYLIANCKLHQVVEFWPFLFVVSIHPFFWCDSKISFRFMVTEMANIVWEPWRTILWWRKKLPSVIREL